MLLFFFLKKRSKILGSKRANARANAVYAGGAQREEREVEEKLVDWADCTICYQRRVAGQRIQMPQLRERGRKKKHTLAQ